MNSFDLLIVLGVVTGLIALRYYHLDLRHQKWRNERLQKRIDELMARDNFLIEELDAAVFLAQQRSHPSASHLAIIEGGAQ